MDENDEITGEENTLLISATALDIYETIKAVKELGGIIIPAHIDRSSYSIISNLGFIPPDISFSCVEITDKADESFRKLYENYKDVEIAIAGIGDFSWDRSPFQLSQFESDGRIADNLFDLYIENGGGGNSWESYTALWYAGLHHTKLDCWNRGKRGILISMGDEICNPVLPKEAIQRVFGDTVQSDIETEALLEEVKEKYDVYHIAITNNSSYSRYESGIKSSFGSLLGQNLIIATSDELPKVISQIVENTINLNNDSNIVITEDGIAW